MGHVTHVLFERGIGGKIHVVRKKEWSVEKKICSSERVLMSTRL